MEYLEHRTSNYLSSGSHPKDEPYKYEGLTEFWEAMNYRIMEGELLLNIPEDLNIFWEMFKDYAYWCQKSPLKRPELIRAGLKAGQTMDIDIPRPMKEDEFVCWTGLTKKQFIDGLREGGTPENGHVLRVIATAIRNQKYDLALIGVYNYKMIMSELGMVEHEEEKPNIVINVIESGKRLAENEEEIEDQEFTNRQVGNLSVGGTTEILQTAIPHNVVSSAPL